MVFGATSKIKHVEYEDFFEGLRPGDEIPHEFIRSDTDLDISTKSQYAILVKSAIIPERFKGMIQDMNINLSGSVTASLMIVILDQSDNIINRVSKDINQSVSGLATTAISSGFAVGVAVQTTGNGTLDSVDFSGVLKYMGRRF